MVVGVVEVCTVHERPCVVVPAFLKSLDRLLIREFIIRLSAFLLIKKMKTGLHGLPTR